MFRKLPTAFRLRSCSAPFRLRRWPKPAATHMVQRHRHVSASPYAYDSVISSSYVTQRGQAKRQSLGETPALPWTQDPESPKP
jgi:hypothetical protein